MNENELLRAILGLCQQWVTNTSGSPPVNTVAPVLTSSGDITAPLPADTLSLSTGTWTNSPTGYVYTFKWNDNTVLQSGASNTYVVQNGDVGHFIKGSVTASNASGSATASSNSSGNVVNPPTNLTLPLIDNLLPQVEETLYVTNGTWTGTPTFTYQWNIDGSPVLGATNSSFTLGSLGYEGSVATCDVTATQNGSTTVTTAGTSAIAANGAGPCVLKLYADNISGVVTDPVATWPDKSGNANDATQSLVPNQPVLEAGPNGKLAVLYDGVASVLITPSINLSATFPASDFTAVIVMKQPTASTTNGAFTGVGGIGAVYPDAFLAYNNVLYFDCPGVDRISIAQPAGWNTGYHLVVLERNSGTVSIRVDQANLQSGGTTTALSGSTPFHLGESFAGDQAYFAMFSVSLTAAGALADVEAFLKSYYGI